MNQMVGQNIAMLDEIQIEYVHNSSCLNLDQFYSSQILQTKIVAYQLIAFSIVSLKI